MITLKSKTLIAALVSASVLLAAPPLQAEHHEESREEIRTAIAEAKEVARIAAEEAREAVRTWSWSWDTDEDREAKGPEPYVGVTIESVPRALRRYVELPRGVGLLIVKVHQDSPAMKGGLQDDDIMVQFNGQLIVNFDQFSTLVDLLNDGDTIPVEVIRKGTRTTVDLTIEERVRKGSRWIKVPDAPDAPDAPAPPAPPGDAVGQYTDDENREIYVQRVTSKIPGSVRIVAGDGGEITEIDLSQLKSNLANLEDRLRSIEIEKNGERIDVHTLVERLGSLSSMVVESEDNGPRQSIVHMGETTLSLSNDEGKVRIFQEGSARHALVTSSDGVVLFDGEIPENLEQSEIDPRARNLIQSLLEMSREVELHSGENLPVELEISEVEKLTRI